MELTLEAEDGRTQSARWREAKPARRGGAVLLPGLGYHPEKPLLHYTTKVLRTSGYPVLEVWYRYDAAAAAEFEDCARADGVAACRAAAERGGPALIVGKSLGTRHLAELVWAGELDDVATVWLTPLLTHAAVVDALAARTAPTLVVAGGQDDATPPDAVDRLRHEAAPTTHVVTVAGADHGLERTAPRDSVDALGEVVDALAGFVVGLARG
jgi:pimeloyl-ACP methyl ester carboxylesterase